MPIETNKSYSSNISGRNKNSLTVSGEDKNASSFSRNSNIEAPKIELPKGGGSIKGIEEKFNVNAVTGTSSFSIPIPVSQSRQGFTPVLQLSYNSASGNGPFGLGWQLGTPSIVRKT
jgi:hypothetical protein